MDGERSRRRTIVIFGREGGQQLKFEGRGTMVVWNFKIYNIFNNVVELFSFSHLLSVNIVLVRMNYLLFASGSERVSTRHTSKRNNASI